MVIYTLERRVFLYDTYIKNKSYKLHERVFCHKYPGVWARALLAIFEFMMKMHSTGLFLDRKYVRQNAVLTKEKLDETEVRIKHSPHMSMT
jgi:hypothetical protein